MAYVFSPATFIFYRTGHAKMTSANCCVCTREVHRVAAAECCGVVCVHVDLGGRDLPQFLNQHFKFGQEGQQSEKITEKRAKMITMLEKMKKGKVGGPQNVEGWRLEAGLRESSSEDGLSDSGAVYLHERPAVSQEGPDPPDQTQRETHPQQLQHVVVHDVIHAAEAERHQDRLRRGTVHWSASGLWLLTAVFHSLDESGEILFGGPPAAPEADPLCGYQVVHLGQLE